MKLDHHILECALLGASVLGGGGDFIKEGRELGDLAFQMGSPLLVDVDDVDPKGSIVTCATIHDRHPADFVPSPRARIRSLELLMENEKDHVVGVITSECTAPAVVNGWIESAVFGLPVVDAPCDGRGHPMAEMGSMRLHLDDGYISTQAFAGGDPSSGAYIEGVMRGALGAVSAMIRQNACSMGGWLAVARNPVSAEHVQKNGAPGAIRRAIALGEAMRSAASKGAGALVEAVEEFLPARRIYKGPVRNVDRFTAGGMNSGVVFLDGFEISFWKDFMTVEENGRRIATFPDLIVAMNARTGDVIRCDNIAAGQEVYFLVAPKRGLLLGGGMTCPELFEPLEKVLGREILPYLGSLCGHREE